MDRIRQIHHPYNDIEVGSQQNADGEKNQPDSRALLKIAFKFSEKSFRNTAALVLRHVERNIEQSRGGSADGKNRQTADDPQDIQPD